MSDTVGEVSPCRDRVTNHYPSSRCVRVLGYNLSMKTRSDKGVPRRPFTPIERQRISDATRIAMARPEVKVKRLRNFTCWCGTVALGDPRRIYCSKDHTRYAFQARRYSISPAVLFKLIQRANGCCMICQRPFEGRTEPSVDHDHTTTKVRGLLCTTCNFGLGSFKDDPSLLASAIQYLK